MGLKRGIDMHGGFLAATGHLIAGGGGSREHALGVLLGNFGPAQKGHAHTEARKPAPFYSISRFQCSSTFLQSSSANETERNRGGSFTCFSACEEGLESPCPIAGREQASFWLAVFFAGGIHGKFGGFHFGQGNGLELHRSPFFSNAFGIGHRQGQGASELRYIARNKRECFGVRIVSFLAPSCSRSVVNGSSAIRDRARRRRGRTKRRRKRGTLPTPTCRVVFE